MSRVTYDAGTMTITVEGMEDVAEALWYLASDAANFITGQVLSPNGGLII